MKAPRTYSTCTTEGCNNLGIRSLRTKPRCHACHARYVTQQRRDRVLAGLKEPIVVPNKYSVDRNGYRVGYAPDHPLSSVNGLITEHRLLAYDKYGSGDQACHWCNKALTWKQVEVDHVDWDRTDNSSDNLVTSCKSCNCNRHHSTVERETDCSEIAQKMRLLAKRLGR
jgi:hypothetical protein